MALWLVRMGKSGEHREKFFADNRIYLTWDEMRSDLGAVNNRDALFDLIRRTYPDAKLAKLRNHAAQIWAFSHEMKKGDWVVIPDKPNPVINVAEITGDYTFDSKTDNPYFHHRDIRWIKRDIPRAQFDQDLLYSLGAVMTICRIERNNAEKRVRQMASGAETPKAALVSKDDEQADIDPAYNLEDNARTQIATLINRRFKGKKLEKLINAVLRAKGYVTHWDEIQKSDGGVDILAASGPMGFGVPTICVQVKSEEGSIGTDILDRLIGTMDRVKADQGLLVSWGGFKDTVLRKMPDLFFRVRMWNQDDIIDEVLAHYAQLGPDIQSELPLKQVWTVNLDEEE